MIQRVAKLPKGTRDKIEHTSLSLKLNLFVKNINSDIAQVDI